MQSLDCGNSRRITFSVAAVAGAVSGNIFTLRRLRELPDLGEANTAFAGAGWPLGKSTARRRRARVVNRPVDDLPSAGALTNFFRGHDIAVVCSGDARAVDASAESGGGDAVDPGVDVRLLLGQHASTLLLVEEDNGLRGKAFPACGSRGSLRVGLAKLRGVGDRFQFAIEPAVKEPEESEAGGFDGGALAAPSVCSLAGRIIEPVAGIGKGLVQSFQVGVAGVGVAVEAEGGCRRRLCLNERQREAAKACDQDQQS